MKSLIVPLLTTASFSTFLICGMVAASSLHLGYTPHKFANINASIWTSTPTRVDRTEQALTREPAELPAQLVAVEPSSEVRAPVDNAIAVTAPIAAPIQQVADTAVSACQARYKSYRASDNSYQPFDGGPRRQCDIGATAVNIGDSASPAVAQSVDQDHQGWCAARYSSYRASDDTYQPFNGTDRRRCMSPVSMASNG